MRKVIILSIALMLFNVSNYILLAQLQGKARIDSLLKELPKAQLDTNYVILLGNLSFEYYSINPDEGIKYGEKGLELAEKLDWNFGKATCFNALGVAFSYGKSNYLKALEYYQKALKINEELGNRMGVGIQLGNIANLYQALSEYPKSLEYYNKALKIHEELGDKFGVSRNIGNIASLYSKTDITKSIEYYYKSLKIDKELGDQMGVAFNYSNLGLMYNNLSNFSKALDYFNNSLKIFEKVGSKYRIANTLGYMGRSYLLQTNDSIIEQSNNKNDLIMNKAYNINKAIEYFNKSLNIYNEIGELKQQSYFLMQLSEAYSIKFDYKNAYEKFKDYKTLQDSIFSMDKQKEFANLEAKRENELKDAEIIILQTEKKAQQFQSYLLGGGVVILFGAFGVSFIRFREKKKLSEQLSNHKSEIESQKFLLEEKNTEILDSINYAATIQNSLLPWSSVLNNSFNDHFIIYLPKNIVSGDSYWFKEVDGIKYLAVIDCTGHGVPGSMLTVIANSVLDDAVLSKKLTSTSDILTYMNEKVTEVLNQRVSENNIRDGMEVGLVAIQKDKIQFSGAGRPLFVKNEKFETIKTDKRGIAGQTNNDTYQYSFVEIEKSENMIIYLSSDGYADQMNENSKKFSTKRFLEILDKNSNLPLEQQKEILKNEFNSHKGNREQIDDVTVVGVKL